MKPCAKINRCHKIADLFDHDWAGDWQLRDAILKTCANCGEYTTEEPVPLEAYREAWNRLYSHFAEGLDDERLNLMDRILESTKAGLTASTT